MKRSSSRSSSKSSAAPRLIDTPADTAASASAAAGDKLAHLRRPLTPADLDKVRDVEGFPIGSDEDIIALSDPPYYTACPNPFLADFIAAYGQRYDERTDTYRCEPFAADVSEGKNDPIYNAHSYHTKVPHKAIMRYILHYTAPGDVVFDGFCGTGMTGVAAQMCADRKAVEELGYRVLADGTVQQRNERGEWAAFSKLGARRAVLCDLSPAATFIAYNYNTPVDVVAFEREARRILDEVETECGWMYETLHTDGKTKGRINYTVWSEVFTCPHCTGEIVFLDEALDPDTLGVKDNFACSHCGATVGKLSLDKIYITLHDPVTGQMHRTLKRSPILIEYTVDSKKFSKRVDKDDAALVRQIEQLPIPPDFVHDELPFMHMTHQRMRIANYGVTHLHHFFLPRARHVLAALWNKAHSQSDPRIRAFLVFAVEQAIWGMSILARYTPTHYSQVNQYLAGVYYISSLISEVSPWYILSGKTDRLVRAFEIAHTQTGNVAISTQSASVPLRSTNCLDYIFTDPPFGENIYYADLNYLIESWHGVKTNSTPEAIIDQAKHKRLADYQELMRQAFRSYYAALKPGRWMTVEFHNSHNAVWNAIQEALSSVGFVVADVRTLDKQQKSYRQITANTAAKQDLVISAYKPTAAFERRFAGEAGTEHGAWEFIHQHLAQLPRVVVKDDILETIAERQNYLLFDRMVAFHIQHGAPVPLSATEFYAGLRQRHPERDGMYFLVEQVSEYDAARARANQVEQLALFVADEKTAVQWLRAQLEREPQTYQDLQPKFLQELHQARHEKLPELMQMLEENFLQEAAGRWYAPDLARAGDLEKLREKGLLREFATYREGKGRLKVFRTEAVRAGFKAAWAAKDYATIVEVARRVPEDVLQEDSDLLMYFDNASLRSGG